MYSEEKTRSDLLRRSSSCRDNGSDGPQLRRRRLPDRGLDHRRGVRASMPTTRSRGETIDKEIVLPEHLHQWVLDQLPGGAGREQGRAFLLPGRTDGIAPCRRLQVALLGVSRKIAHENRRVETFGFRGCVLSATRSASTTTPP
jgi:hypothetical protein